MITCPNCGRELEDFCKFCKGCGVRLSPPPSLAPTMTPPPPPLPPQTSPPPPLPAMVPPLPPTAMPPTVPSGNAPQRLIVGVLVFAGLVVVLAIVVCAVVIVRYKTPPAGPTVGPRAESKTGSSSSSDQDGERDTTVPPGPTETVDGGAGRVSRKVAAPEVDRQIEDGEKALANGKTAVQNGDHALAAAQFAEATTAFEGAIFSITELCDDPAHEGEDFSGYESKLRVLNQKLRETRQCESDAALAKARRDSGVGATTTSTVVTRPKDPADPGKRTSSDNTLESDREAELRKLLGRLQEGDGTGAVVVTQVPESPAQVLNDLKLRLETCEAGMAGMKVAPPDLREETRQLKKEVQGALNGKPDSTPQADLARLTDRVCTLQLRVLTARAKEAADDAHGNK